MCAKKCGSMTEFLSIVGLAGGTDSLNLGQIVCLGTEDLRDRLGEERWTKAQAHIGDVIEKSIAEHCNAQDAFFKCRDASFLIVFSTRSADKSELIAAAIANAVNKILMGTEDLRAVTVRGISQSGSHLTLTEAKDPLGMLDALQNKAHKVSISDEDAAPAAAKPAMAEAQAKSPGQTRTGTGGSMPSIPKGNRAELLAKLSIVKDAPVEFRFLPIWFNGERKIWTFNCAPMRPSTMVGETTWNYGVLGAKPQISEVVDLDIAALEHGLIELTDHLVAGRQCQLVPNIHFETLTNYRGRNEISALLGALPQRLRQSILPNIMYVPQGVPDGRLTDITGHLKPFCKQIGAVLVPSKLEGDVARTLTRLKNCGFSGIFVRANQTITRNHMDWILHVVDKINAIGGISGVTAIPDDEHMFKFAYSPAKVCAGESLGGPFETMPAPYEFDAKKLESRDLAEIA